MNEQSRSILVEPFPDDAVSSRKGTHGKTLQYIETWRVVDRLNTAFDHDWSFKVVEWQQLEHEVVVCGELSAAGLVKQAFGSSSITRGRDSGEPLSIGDDVKAAASDALKKAATLLGVGLELYSGRRLPESKESTADTPTRPAKDVGRLTERQSNAILSLAARQGLKDAQIRTRILDLYGLPLEQLSRRTASELISRLNNGALKRTEGGVA